jgi:hypothetical protein
MNLDRVTDSHVELNILGNMTDSHVELMFLMICKNFQVMAFKKYLLIMMKTPQKIKILKQELSIIICTIDTIGTI